MRERAADSTFAIATTTVSCSAAEGDLGHHPRLAP
jgi:hypothetical protein